MRGMRRTSISRGRAGIVSLMRGGCVRRRWRCPVVTTTSSRLGSLAGRRWQGLYSTARSRLRMTRSVRGGGMSSGRTTIRRRASATASSAAVPRIGRRRTAEDVLRMAVVGRRWRWCVSTPRLLLLSEWRRSAAAAATVLARGGTVSAKHLLLHMRRRRRRRRRSAPTVRSWSRRLISRRWTAGIGTGWHYCSSSSSCSSSYAAALVAPRLATLATTTRTHTPIGTRRRRRRRR